MFSFKVASLNTCGINDEKKNAMLDRLADGDLDICLLNETRAADYLSSDYGNDNSHPHNGILFFQTQPSKKGGVLTLHRRSEYDKQIKYIQKNIMYTTFRKNRKVVNVINVYIPPGRSVANTQLVSSVLGII